MWRHQAWNLSYNVSVAFDDYRDKYYWVIEGIKFLQEGVQYNEREPRLLVGRRLVHLAKDRPGRRVEAVPPAVQGRRRLPEGRPADRRRHRRGRLRDNWQVGKAWFRAVEYMVDTWGLHCKGKSPMLVFSDAPMCQMYYGDTLEKEGRFEEVARRAWQKAGKDWYEYGQHEFDTYDGKKMHLNDQEAHEEAARKRVEGARETGPGPARENSAGETRRVEAGRARGPERARRQAHAAASRIGCRCRVAHRGLSHEELARRVTGAHRDQARKLAAEAAQHEEMASYVRHERSTVNFDYWRLRAHVEQDPETFAARKAVHQGDVAYADNRPTEAKQHYEEGLKGWRKVLDRFPTLKEDRTTGDDLMDVIRHYHRVLTQLDETLPQPFILQDILDKYGKKKE